MTEELKMTEKLKKMHIAKYTKDLGSDVIQILNTYFMYISPNLLMFDGHKIAVNVERNDMAKVECVEFLDALSLRKAIGPVHFISLNRIYNFDISLYVSSENFIFTKDYNISDKLPKFIQREQGTIIDINNEYILCTIQGEEDIPNQIVINIMYLTVEDGFIVEISKILQHFKYGKKYDEFVSNFIKEFKPKNQSISIDLASF